MIDYIQEEFHLTSVDSITDDNKTIRTYIHGSNKNIVFTNADFSIIIKCIMEVIYKYLPRTR